MSAQAGLTGVTVDRPTPPGGSITGGAEPAQVLVNFGPFQSNLTTGQSGLAKDKTFKFGGAIGVGFEVDFDPRAFRDITSQNQACRQMGGQ